MALAIAAVFAFALEDAGGPGAVLARRRRRTRRLLWWLLGGIVVLSAFYYPIWTAIEVPRWFWEIHMWLPSWI
jgi:dolichyl-phosphate-mannose--protein O-mannosyl transferase